MAAGTRGSSGAGDGGGSSDQTRLTPAVPNGADSDVFSGVLSMVLDSVPVC